MSLPANSSSLLLVGAGIDEADQRLAGQRLAPATSRSAFSAGSKNYRVRACRWHSSRRRRAAAGRSGSGRRHRRRAARRRVRLFRLPSSAILYSAGARRLLEAVDDVRVGIDREGRNPRGWLLSTHGVSDCQSRCPACDRIIDPDRLYRPLSPVAIPMIRTRLAVGDIFGRGSIGCSTILRDSVSVSTVRPQSPSCELVATCRCCFPA